MLQGYVDDSGSHTGDKRLFLAGYIHRPDAWTAFSDDWQAALQEAPALAFLHMTKSFYGWRPEAREAKLQRLASVIAKYQPLSIEASMSTKDFKDAVKPNVPHDLRHPYGYCFQALVVKSAELIHHYELDGPLDFIFDEQGNVGLHALDFYPLMKQMHGPVVQKLLGGTPVFKSDLDVLPLQAADMLAWHRRIVREPSCKAQDHAIAESIIFNHATVDIPREMLLRWASAFAKIPGIEEAKSSKTTIRYAMRDIVSAVPPDQLVPFMRRLVRRSRRLRLLRVVLERIGLRRLWKKLTKRR